MTPSATRRKAIDGPTQCAQNVTITGAAANHLDAAGPEFTTAPVWMYGLVTLWRNKLCARDFSSG